MADQYSWETGVSTYTPPRNEGVGGYFLVAVVLALAAHVGALVLAGNTIYRADINEPVEWVSEPIRLTSVESEPEPISEAPPEEALERPVDDTELIDNTEDAIAELRDLEIDFDTQLEEPELPEMVIEKPKLAGIEEGELPEPVIGDNVNPDIPEPGKMTIDFPEAKANQLVVVDDGSPLADILDPDRVVAELGNLKGAGGDNEKGVIEGYTGLADYAKMAPGDLERNKASIGSDLLFEFNSATLRDDARLTLMTVAMLIDRNPGMYCWVEGHTDLFGSEDFNLRLSEQRAQAVKDWLVRALQLGSKEIVVIPYGKAAPIVLEGDPEAQAPNRRVDIKMRKTLPEDSDEPSLKVLVKPGVAIPVEEDEEEIPVAIPVAIPVEEVEDIPVAIPVEE